MILISIPDKIPEQVLNYLSKKVFPKEIYVNTDLSDPLLPLDDVEIWITYGTDVTSDNLSRMSKLKWIQIFQSGVEGIPFKELKKRNVMLTNIKGIHNIPMTEYVLSVILYFTRCISRYNKYKSQKNGIEKNIRRRLTVK